MDTALTILTGVVVALGTAFFTSRFYVHQATADLRNEYQKRFNEKKWDSYTNFSSTVKDLLVSTLDDRLTQDQRKHRDKLLAFISELWLVGSDDVVRAVSIWKQTKEPMESMTKLIEILIVMRKDLGYTETQIHPRDLLGTFVNDVGTVFPKL